MPIMSVVEGLRDDQLALLERHRELSHEIVLDALAGYDGSTALRETVAGKHLLSSPRPLLVSVAVACFAWLLERRDRIWKEAETTRVVAAIEADAGSV